MEFGSIFINKVKLYQYYMRKKELDINYNLKDNKL
jgi:hypothetical protein